MHIDSYTELAIYMYENVESVKIIWIYMELVMFTKRKAAVIKLGFCVISQADLHLSM